MGIPDRSFLDLIEKVRSWIWWGGSDLSSVSREFLMPNNSYRMCCECGMRLTEFSVRHLCQSCGRGLCGKCLQDGLESTTEDREQITFCKFCFQSSNGGEVGRMKPSVSPGQSPERDLSCFSSKKFKDSISVKMFQSDHLARFFEVPQHDSSPHAGSSSSVASFMGHPSPVSFRRSSSRSDEDDVGDSGKQFFSHSSQYCQDNSDIDSNSVSARHEVYSFKSVGSSPFDSPSRMIGIPNRAHYSPQQEQRGSPRSQYDAPLDQEAKDSLRRHETETETETEDLENIDDGSDDSSVFRDHCKKAQEPLDLESNGLIWFPPPPNDEDDEAESNFFEYDDDDNVGESGMIFSSSSFNSDAFPVKEKPNQGHKEPLQAAVHGHFRALVSQLLEGEGILTGKENGREDWLDIVTSVAWQAANFVKPDTSRGGSMDPGDYVKVKCIVSGYPIESTLIKGVVCTKNIKHKRMPSQYRNPRLLLLGGALEYQRVSNQLASFDTLLQQEIDYLKMIISKIEAHRPNVLLVEKSVSSYAQEYLLEKEISLVLNVKKPLLERIARCTRAVIVPSTDNLSSARLGHCEIFRVEKISKECLVANQPNKKQAKTLMFFEGCPKRSGCTVLLKGTCREELKKVKDVVQYAVFAAYHLSLETSFLADEGATLPRIPLNTPIAISERINADNATTVVSKSAATTVSQAVADEYQYVGAWNLPTRASYCCPASDIPAQSEGIVFLSSKLDDGSSDGHHDPGHTSVSSPGSMDSRVEKAYSDAYNDQLFPHVAPQSCNQQRCKELRGSQLLPSDVRTHSHELLESLVEKAITSRNHRQPGEFHGITKTDGNEISSEYFCAADNHQSILVSLSSRCVLKGTVCERSRLLRIKFYGSFDKPLGRYLRDDLFDQNSCCRSCKEPAEAHVRCYTHQKGSLTIHVRCLPSLKLPGERDGKIWMWHRCLKCVHIDGVPPATRRVVMSDAAWGLSFGKFLELSFSNNATANRIANCGHSLQRDCLRYYGFGSMVAFFRYSPIEILSVCLPPSMLEFGGRSQQEWVTREAAEVSNRTELLYAEIYDKLHSIEHKLTSFGHEPSNISEFQNHISELKDLLRKERNEYNGLLQPAGIEASLPDDMRVDILEFSRFRRSLLIDSYIWDHRLYSLDTLLQTKSSASKVDLYAQEVATYGKFKEWRSESIHKDGEIDYDCEENNSESCASSETPRNALQSEQKEEPKLPLIEHTCNELEKREPLTIKSDEGFLEDPRLSSGQYHQQEEIHEDEEVAMEMTSLETILSPASNLSDKIDLAWTGKEQVSMKVQLLHSPQVDGSHAGFDDRPSHRRLMSPVRVHSFDSALRIQERIRKGKSPASLHLSPLRSFHASGEYRNMIRDPVSNVFKTYSQISARGDQTSSFIFGYTPSIITSASCMADEGVRLLLPRTGYDNIVIAVYDNEPTSIISYALGSKEYQDWIIGKLNEHEGDSVKNGNKEDSGSLLSSHHSTYSTHSVWNSFGSLELDDIYYRSYGSGSEDVSVVIGSLFSDPKKSPHVRISFGDESLTPAGKAKFSITCYFAKQFDALRKKCCPGEVDFIRSLSRCKRWSAQGGKSNVYFAKSLDDRFIIKQVTKTELDSFEEFAPEYFKYLTDSLSTGSPTCLAKVLGIYQVTVKHLKGGKEMKMDLMVMENLFFGRSMSRIYDLKGSARSRYNPDTTGKNKVLLDMNLLETLCTEPIFLGSKAKRILERAIWNDTSFLASVDVMDYSLLVGVDGECKELVVGIIDYMRQYTWDKHLETWVKASGILGGPKNATPTVISPKQYKKRFRKAMSTYFLTVPDQWSS